MTSRIATRILTLVLLSTSWATGASRVDDLRKEARQVPKDGARALALAQRLRRAGLYDDGLRVARAALASARGASLVGDLFLEVARDRIAQHDHRGAMRECDRLDKLDEVKRQICIAEAQLLNRRGSLALPAAEAALAKAPTSYDARVAKGRALLQLGQVADAEATLRRAAEQEPTRFEARRELAQLLFDRQRPTEALDVLRAARKVDPTQPELLLLIGEYAPDRAEAAQALREAVVARPGEPMARALLGRRLLEQGDLAGAQIELEAALALNGHQADWHADLGDVQLARKAPDAALAAARAALGIVMNHAHAKLVEAKAFAMKGDIDLAIAAFEAAAGLARRDPKPLVHGAVACLEHGRPTTGRAFADRATEEFPDWGPAWVVAGDVAANDGDKAGARAAYARALRSKGPVDAGAVKRKLSALR